MKQLKYIIFSALIILSSHVSAELFPDYFTIGAVMPSNVGMHVTLSPNPAQCTGNWWGNQFVIKKETDNYNGLSAAILAAYMAGKKIRAVHYAPEGDGSCSHSNWLSVYAFQVVN